MAEEIASNLVGKRISRTFRGLMHMPHSIDTTTFEKQIVYDGQGTPTALTLGGINMGADISGDVSISRSLSVSQNFSLTGNAAIGGNVTLLSGGTINDVTINNVGSEVSLRSLNGLEAGKVRIRESTENFELIYGNPNIINNNRNLFTLKVNNDLSRNFYIKNDYFQPDLFSPLWINRATGEVNIRYLKVSKIVTIPDPKDPVGPPTVFPRTPDAHRNEVPIGMIAIFPVSAYSGATSPNTMPDGWIECDGSLYDTALFPELFAIIKWNYSSGTVIGSSKFAVPDLRGLFVRGWDHARVGETGHVFRDADTARAIGSVQQDTLKSHKHDLHNISDGTLDVYASYVIGTVYVSLVPPGITSTGVGASVGVGATHVIKAGSGGYTENFPDISALSGKETRPKNMTMVYAIKW